MTLAIIQLKDWCFSCRNFTQKPQVLGTDRERSHKEKLWNIIFSGEFFSYFCLNMSHEPPFWLHICPESLDFRKLLKHLKLTYYSVKSPLCCCMAFRPQCCLPDLHQAVPYAHPQVHTWQTVVRNRRSHATKGLGQSFLGSLMNLQWSNKGPYDLHDTPASSDWLGCLGLQDRWLTITTPMMLSWWFAVVLYIPKRITLILFILVPKIVNHQAVNHQSTIRWKESWIFFHIRRIRMSSIVMSKQFLLQLIKHCHCWLYGNWFVHPLIHPISTKTLEADSCTFLNQGSDSLERRRIQTINNAQGFLDNYHNESPYSDGFWLQKHWPGTFMISCTKSYKSSTTICCFQSVATTRFPMPDSHHNGNHPYAPLFCPEISAKMSWLSWNAKRLCQRWSIVWIVSIW